MIDSGKRARADAQKAIQARTTTFAKKVVLLIRHSARTIDARHVASQLMRCSTSVAANYRAPVGRGPEEFAAKIGIVVEEADESLFWLEFAIETDVLPAPAAKALADKATQLVATFSATRTRTLKNSRSLNP